MEANNKYVAIVEQRMKDAAPAEEVLEMRTTISRLTCSLKNSQGREEETKKKLAGVQELERRNEVLAAQLKDCQSQSYAAMERSAFLNQQNKDLIAEKDNSLRLAARATYRQLSAKYGQLLQSFKEKWAKKKEHTDAEISLQEATANLQLIRDLMNGESTLAVEAPLWEKRVVELDAEAKAKAVSDFSMGKLEMPQLSEDSVLMEINKETQAPKGLDQFGTNASLVEAALGDLPAIRLEQVTEAGKEGEAAVDQAVEQIDGEQAREGSRRGTRR